MSNYTPAAYGEIMGYNSQISPSTVHVKNTALARFFKRYLLQEAMSVFDWTMPESWDRAYFLYVLYLWGYIAIVKTNKFGVIPQHGGLGGVNVYYGPQFIIITNPLLKRQYKLDINADCAVLRLQPDYCGLYDLVDYYGDIMALAAETAGVNLLNSRLSFVYGATNKASAESFKKLYDDIASGNPAAFVDKQLFDEDGKLRVTLFNQDVGGSFIVPELLDCLRTVRCMFLTDIGIPNVNVMKQSGVTDSEIAANDFETRAKCSLWLDELKKGCKIARDLFPGLELDVNWRNDLRLEERGLENERSVALDSGSLQ